jgi:thiol-disulfide isomerase/thioredoxin
MRLSPVGSTVAVAVALGAGLLAHFLWPASKPNPAVAQFFATEVLLVTPTAPSGQRVRLNSFRDQNGIPQVLVVNFWGTWCPPCIKEMPELSALKSELAGKPVEFLGIGIDSAAKIAEFAVKVPVSYPLFAVGYQGIELGNALGNVGGALPFTVLIDRKGALVWQRLGVVDVEDLNRRIHALL